MLKHTVTWVSYFKELGRLDEAEKSLRQAITLKPDYAESTQVNLGRSYLQKLG